jgi:nitroimidazol reductase NimA-like FMN-containing flavoprotein (pyridoxamine 5'-phosphate oxidase superfamily)
MPSPTGANGVGADAELEELDVAVCWDLVRSRAVGRFAVNRHGSCPLVVPVNYVVESATSVVFRSGPGSKLNVDELDLVALQVDEIDPLHHTGWSVLIAGRARWLYEEQADVALDTWVPGELPYVIRIVPTEVTGRRIQLHQPDTDPRGYR